MARPCKSVKTLSNYSQTKGELDERNRLEEQLSKKGIPPAPEWLTKSTKEYIQQHNRLFRRQSNVGHERCMDIKPRSNNNR